MNARDNASGDDCPLASPEVFDRRCGLVPTGKAPGSRSPRRQRLTTHLHACGPRPVLEALLELGADRPLDEVLEEYARLPARIYHAPGADVLPIDVLAVIDGGQP